jgi:aerobic-type carbon monoxide dehydrogenase small subunit (CoxS/CutS family)
MERFELVVNGTARSVEAERETPLLWVLRDELGLVGTKYGCGEGLCGACTVLEADAAVRACVVPIAAAAGKSYTTIEGLSPDGGNRCQTAWLDEQVAQCGYCQPGMILEVESLLRRNPRPTAAELDGVLADHLCRCGSYPRAARAARRAAGIGVAP